MEPVTKKIDSPAWEHPAPGNEQNDAVKGPTHQTVKTGGNSRSAEDDLNLNKQPYTDIEFKNQDAKHASEQSNEDWKEDNTEDPDEQAVN